jgi:hypothetical protein
MTTKSLVLVILLTLTTILGACQGGKEVKESNPNSPAVESSSNEDRDDDADKENKKDDDEKEDDDD